MREVAFAAGLCCLCALGVPALAQQLDAPRPIEWIDTVFIEEMTWMEVRDAIAAGKTTAIVATGGIEQNGPYVASGKHNFVLAATTEAIARELGDALVAPIVKFVPEGNIDPPSGHMRYHATISLREETFEALLTDVVSSLAQHGFADIVLIGDSGGNRRGMAAVAEGLNARWMGTPARVHLIPEYYSEDIYSCEYLKAELAIFQQPDECRATRNEYHDDYHYSSIIATTDPVRVRAQQRIAVGLFHINGVDLAPLETTIANGRKLVAYRAEITARAIRRAIEGSRTQLAPQAATETLRVGIIELYGARGMAREVVIETLGLVEGEPFDRSAWRRSTMPDAVERLRARPGVRDARVSAVCCDEAGRLIVYVGLQQDEGPSFDFNPAPTGAARLPAEILETHWRFEEALQRAMAAGDDGDDISQGHSLAANPAVRGEQEKFLEYARRNLPLLREALHTARSTEQRAIAAFVIGYAADKREIVADLERAVADPSPLVRNNAVRNLGAIATLANRNPELGITVSPDPFIDLLHSIEWSDRNKAVFVLYTLTASPDRALLDRLREDATEPLAEMARWRHPGHAWGARVLLGRLAGLGDAEIQMAFEAEAPDAVVARLIGRIENQR